MVSARFSPFLTDAISGSAKPRVEPPSRCMADSKLRRVLVLGSKNKVASILPLSMSEAFVMSGSMVFAVLKMWLISSLVRSLMLIMSRSSNPIFRYRSCLFVFLVDKNWLRSVKSV